MICARPGANTFSARGNPRNMPGKPYQSKLEPHYEFIRECRAKRWSYARIAASLGAEHALKVTGNSVFSFVKVRAKGRKLYTLPERSKAGQAVSPEVRRKADDFFKSEPNKDHEPKSKKLYNIGF